MSVKLIVGLCNPGDAYQATRHNAGAWLVNVLAERQHAPFKVDKKFQGELATLTLNGKPCYALLPHTFMNRSGVCVRAVSQFYRILPEEILVVHDDLDLPVGRIKLKTGGGHGGHNGLRDLIAQLGGAHFHRLRIGIGHPGHKALVLDYVLGKPSAVDREAIMHAIHDSLDGVSMTVDGRINDAMTRLNTNV